MWECNELIHIKSLKQGPKRALNKCQLLITPSPSFSCIFLSLSLCLYSWASTSLLKSDSAFKVQPLIDHRSQPVRRGGAIWIIESNPLILQMKSQRHREAHSVAQGHSASLRQTWSQTHEALPCHLDSPSGAGQLHMRNPNCQPHYHHPGTCSLGKAFYWGGATDSFRIFFFTNKLNIK